MKRSMNQKFRRTYLRRVYQLAQSVRAGELSKGEASACAAGTLLRIWDEHGFTPATAMGKHLCAYENGRMDIDIEIDRLGELLGPQRWR